MKKTHRPTPALLPEEDWELPEINWELPEIDWTPIEWEDFPPVEIEWSPLPWEEL